ncbi:hypothetical protein [Caldovatus aquaticus]|uniref:Lipoprotein n=1 Tax=Caldovatus aquaticus TaxID=2865671 RepID=A0ABS7F4W1_9PROT|nr:hypothetical protein [Caldovatus aquaticus]MBW8270654.1 hypothetical protein [Caldovatus aquaticus]
MTRIAAGRAMRIAAALAGLGACTVVDESPGYYASGYGYSAPGYATSPGYGYGYGYRAAPGYATVPGRYGVPYYAAAAAAGDSYCREAVAAVRRAKASAAYTGSPEAIARVERAHRYASRDC